MARLLQSLVRPFMAFCYPGQCACCRALWDGEGPWCEACEKELSALRGVGACAACAACGMPLPVANAPCPYCKGRGLFPYRDVVRLGVFREPLRGLIHSLKYHRQWQLGELLAERLHGETQVRELLERADCLVPVPLHWRRQLMRGYNQSAVLAERLGRLAHRDVVRSAVRVRHTQTQTHLHSRAKRADNLRGAFALRSPGSLEGKHVVVVDDVMTTGATLQSLGRVLKAAGPIRLSAIVLAIADPKGHGFEGI